MKSAHWWALLAIVWGAFLISVATWGGERGEHAAGMGLTATVVVIVLSVFL